MSDSNLLETLNDKVSDAKRAFYGLKPREQYLVMGLGAVFALLLAYLLLIRPATGAVEASEKRLQAKQELLQWMKSNESVVMSSRGGASGAPSLNGQDILGIVNSAASRNGIQLQRYEPEGQSKLRVWLENVSFNNLTRWLDQLQNNNGVSVSSISLDSGKASGFVSAKVLLKG